MARGLPALATFVAVLAQFACGSNSDSTPTAPSTTTPTTQSAYNPDAPTPGLDTSERRLLDGGGNPGAVRVQLQSVFPPIGHQAPAGAPELQVQFNAPRICMDAITVANPPNSPYIAEMRIAFYTSEDGVVAKPPFQVHFSDPEGTIPFKVRNGECIAIRRVLASLGGTPGAQFIIFARPTRFLMMKATYGPNPPPSSFDWSAAPCPSYEAIARGQWNTAQGTPNCTLRISWPLDYRW